LAILVIAAFPVCFELSGVWKKGHQTSFIFVQSSSSLLLVTECNCAQIIHNAY